MGKMVTESVCAVVVTYNPAPTFVDNALAIATQVGQVVVVDNGSSGGTESQLQRLDTAIGCHLIRNRENLGIAAALNLGVRYGIDGGFEWICTFDQDSQVCDEFVSKMLE